LQFEASWGKKFYKTLYRKTLHKSRAGGVAQAEDPEFKPQYHKQTNKERVDTLVSFLAL
jgi:hypothetical protein